MFSQHLYAGPVAASSLRQRFLDSSSGVLDELNKLLLDSPAPIDPTTGAQIAQTLRAIREGAVTYALDRIAQDAANMEMYLTSSEAYGPDGNLRNFVLGSRIEDLQRRFASATEE
jgi:hypothetical protein